MLKCLTKRFELLYPRFVVRVGPSKSLRSVTARTADFWKSLRKSSLAAIGALLYRKHRPLIQDMFDPCHGPELISDKFPTHAILLVVRNWAGSFGLPMISIIAAVPMARPNGIEWPEISVPEIPLIPFRGLFPACGRYLQHCWMTNRTTWPLVAYAAKMSAEGAIQRQILSNLLLPLRSTPAHQDKAERLDLTGASARLGRTTSAHWMLRAW